VKIGDLFISFPLHRVVVYTLTFCANGAENNVFLPTSFAAQPVRFHPTTSDFWEELKIKPNPAMTAMWTSTSSATAELERYLAASICSHGAASTSSTTIVGSQRRASKFPLILDSVMVFILAVSFRVLSHSSSPLAHAATVPVGCIPMTDPTGNWVDTHSHGQLIYFII
jgi:hypothetical protein